MFLGWGGWMVHSPGASVVLQLFNGIQKNVFNLKLHRYIINLINIGII